MDATVNRLPDTEEKPELSTEISFYTFCGGMIVTHGNGYRYLTAELVGASVPPKVVTSITKIVQKNQQILAEGDMIIVVKKKV